MFSRFSILLCLIVACSPKQDFNISKSQTDFSIKFIFNQKTFIYDYEVFRDQDLILSQTIQEESDQIVLATSNYKAGSYSVNFKSTFGVYTSRFTIDKKAEYPIYIQIPAGGFTYSIYNLPEKLIITQTDSINISLSSLNRFDSKITLTIENSSPIQLGKTANSYHEIQNSTKRSQKFSIKKNDSVIYKSQINLEQLSLEEFRNKIEMKTVLIPTNSLGEQIVYEENMTLFIADKLIDVFQENFMGGTRNKEQTSPYTYLSFELDNKLASSKVFYSQAKFKNKTSGKIVKAFTPKSWELNGLAEFSTSSVLLKSEALTKMIIPIYIDRDKVESGVYDLIVELTMLGFDDVIHAQEFEIKIDRHNTFLLIFYLLVVVIAILYFIHFLKNINLVFDSLKIEALITISIFAAIHFVFSFIAQIFDSTILAFLGPFRIFISNFFTECLTYTILVSLYFLYPKKGVLSLKLIVSFLLSVVLTGGGILLTLFNTLLMIAGLELTFRFFYKKSILLLFVMLGILDAFISFIQIVEMKLFYRLLYSDWYIFLMMFIVGFIYTVIGSYFGLAISKKLKKVIHT